MVLVLRLILLASPSNGKDLTYNCPACFSGLSYWEYNSHSVMKAYISCSPMADLKTNTSASVI